MEELLARLRAALRRGALGRRRRRRSSRPTTSPSTSAPSAVTSPAGEVRLTPTEWHMVETLVRNAGRLVTSPPAAARRCGGRSTSTRAATSGSTSPIVRRKLEPNPSQPRYFLTEPGMGYRFEGGRVG